MSERWNIDAGQMRQRVTIEAKSVASAPDSRGHTERTWYAAITNVSAKVETPTGRKLELAKQLVSSATHVITMRYRKLDEANNRIAYCGRVFSIGHQEDVDERHVKLVLTCTELKGPTAETP